MSIYKQILATASVFAMTAALVITPSAVAQNNSVAGLVTTTSNTNGYSFCSSAINGFVVNDINGSIKTTTDSTLRNFYVIRNADKTNDSCTNGFVKTNYLPVFNNHTTTFDLDTDGAPTNVKLTNTNPSSYSVTCSGTDTVVTITDAERDNLTLSQVVKADDFNYPLNGTTGNNNELKVTFSRKDSTVKTVNVVDIYVAEGAVSGNAGQFRTDAEGKSIAVVTSTTTEDATPKVIKLAGISIASPSCDPALNVSSSSSMTSSSSMMSSSSAKSSMMSSSSAVAGTTTTTTTTVTTDTMSIGKGSTVRTGGAN